MMIDTTARIHPSAQIAANVVMGPWVYIGENVVIGEGCKIDPHAVVLRNTTMGKNNHIHSNAVVGGDPQDLGYRGEAVWLKMGDDNIVREFLTINRGSAKSGTTFVGNKNCFLSYAHVAQDCHIGNEVLFVNCASVAGHVTVDDYAIIGAYSTVHQFTRIGAYSFLAQGAQVPNDIPPFMLVTGIPGIPVTLNLVGLRRRGFSANTISGLKKAFRVLYRQNLSLKDAENALNDLVKETPEIQMIIDVMQSSKRGLVRKQVERDAPVDD